MKAKKEYYKNYVDRRIRVKKLIYFLILLVAFCIVLYDSFINNLPFHYIVFFFIGRLMSLILNKTQKVKVREADNKFTAERNIAGFFVIVAIVLLRLFIFPKILAELNVVFISDALFLIVVGWFLGRVSLLSNKIEEMAFTEFMKRRPSKD